jgi:tripartite-type tricarboxylate transporter receptor subunit TctC
MKANAHPISRQEAPMNAPLLRTAALACLALACGTAPAQDGYPSRPVRIVVQYQAGGSTDTVARILAESLAKRLGQPVVVVFR